jgi:hypothetical protein
MIVNGLGMMKVASSQRQNSRCMTKALLYAREWCVTGAEIVEGRHLGDVAIAGNSLDPRVELLSLFLEIDY